MISFFLNVYEYDVNQFLTFLQNHECSTELTKTQVRRFIQYQLGISNQKPRSMNRKISCLQSFTKYSILEKYLKHDFMTGIETLKTNDELLVYMKLPDLQ
ncbi:hypothetical protein BLX88_09845 [Bacillus obstructivus]|uniref:site-specific integrase n=1 Tax=Heyndrickxia oleronia TaxID=38875 RepID=UPI000903B294|nr:hypothetical protein BLX88_09845 [Bacillus obstructivus]